MSLTRRWAPPGPYDLRRSLGVLRRGPYDPAYRVAAGAVWRTQRTPDGPATLRLAADGTGVRADAWGPGAAWALDRLPALLGAEDRPEEFTAHHRVTREAHRRNPGVRLVRTGLVLESLIPSVLEQKVTADEAYRAWRLLLRRFGEPAPGPAAGRPEGLYVTPAPRTWALVPSWEWHRAGVDGKRSATVLRACRVASRLEEAAAMALPDAMARLQAVPGIGPWTAAETLQRSNGEPDAITVGDLHLPRQVGYALTGRRDTDDAGMLALLAPYAGQRHRAARLVLAGGPALPRRAPRMYVRDTATI
ncbi:DNA-3-methyladenine glycosylase 2 family protein [Streptomyces sp. TRM 70351]|uniref:DNA-3-methyladenine glycosylase family protein n=1 Tax=Streptomyces sp. TRM 70351 TaxID=3116552 RepID=UPI002E7C2817|nr:DNA-3-methyladenine glycosylase 2 family protein [Streptomyces sp. TRM 70351]MEE1929322.1 DNA-3-methyladenine glycosylase 2 family protein [Streptomyces sp. TRM 70351]